MKNCFSIVSGALAAHRETWSKQVGPCRRTNCTSRMSSRSQLLQKIALAEPRTDMQYRRNGKLTLAIKRNIENMLIDFFAVPDPYSTSMSCNACCDQSLQTSHASREGDRDEMQRVDQRCWKRVQKGGSRYQSATITCQCTLWVFSCLHDCASAHTDI